MIVTLTPNPSVDRTFHLAALRHGGVNRVVSSTVEPSGKGVNVARALAANGVPVVAVLPLGGAEGDQLAGLLRPAALRLVGVPIAGAVRSNVTLLEPDGVATKVNEAGPRLSPAEAEALLSATMRAASGSAWTVCCGSLPPGVAVDFYAQVVTRVHAAGGRVAVDTSGVPLRLAAEAGADLLKPNVHELAEVVGGPLDTLADVAAAAARLRGSGAGAVLVSLGPDGALFVGAETHYGEAPSVRVVSTVGAGDALLAGFLAAGADGRTALRTALSWSAACCQAPNSQLPAVDPRDANGITVHDGLTGRRRLVPHD